MKLYAIITDGVNGPEPLYNYGTGAPSVYANEQKAIDEVADLEFETEE